jgi:Flp pilus assembly protein TadD
LALCGLQAVAGDGAPNRVETINGVSLKMGVVRATFPEQDLALIQFKHRPKQWLTVDPRPVEPGERVAILDITTDEPVAVGPVLGRRSILVPHHKRAFFHEALSLGASLRGSPMNQVLAGQPVIDADGQLIGVFRGLIPATGQTLVLVNPLATIHPRIVAAGEEKESIPVPLPAANNPYDAAQFEASYNQALRSMMSRDLPGAEKQAGIALQKHPDSRLIRNLQSDLARMGRNSDLLKARLEALRPGADATPAERVGYLKPLSEVRYGEGDKEGALDAMRESVRLSPANYPDDKANLAGLLVEQGNLIEAEVLLRQAMKAAPERIELIQTLRSVLGRQQKWDEDQALMDRIDELESLYRRR